VESESSLPYSQQSATCPYTDTDKSCLLAPITFKYLFQQNPRIYDYVSHVVFFLQIPPPKSGTHFFPQTFPTPRISHQPLFYHFNNIRRRAQILKLLVMHFSPVPCYLVSLRPKYPPQHPILKHTGMCPSLIVRDQVLKPYKTKGKIRPTIPCNLLSVFSYDKGKNKDTGQNGRLPRLLLNKLRIKEALIAVNASGT